MKTLILSLTLTAAAWGTAYTANNTGVWSNAAVWTPVGVPGAGDTVTINGAVTQDVANLVIGVNGAAPQYGYMKTFAGGGGTGYTSCTASISGGTTIRAGTVGCAVVNGSVIPFITDRGWYSACPTVTLAGTGGTGGTFPGTLTCQAGGGTPAITVNGSLTLAATNTYVRGTLALEGSYGVYGMALSLNPGTNLYMDMSQSAGAMYSISDEGYGRQIITDCTASQCSIQGYSGTTTIDYLTANEHLMVLDVKNVLFKNVGDASTRTLSTADSWDNIGRRMASIVNSTFDSCGMIDVPISNMGIIYTGNTHRNTPVHYAGEPPQNVYILASTAEYTPNIRVVQNNTFDGYVGYVLRDFILTGNVFSGGLRAIGTMFWKTFTDNFWRFGSPDLLGDGSAVEYAGSTNNMYFFLDAPAAINPHYLSSDPALGYALTHANLVGGFSGRNPGDSGEWIGGAPVSTPTTTQNAVFLCDASGLGSSQIASPPGPTMSTFTLLHNTWCGGFKSFGMIDVNETGDNPTGYLTMKSSIAWDTDLGSHSSRKLLTINTPGTQDVCATTSATVSNCDYNAGYRTDATNRGYVALWSYTPGYHDVDGQNPRFLDSSRKVENFDTKYMAQSLSTQWVNGNAYSYGDLASNSDVSSYQGETFNFRCINSSGCTGKEAPGTGTRSAAGTLTAAVVDVTSMYMSTIIPIQAYCKQTDGSPVSISGIAPTGNPITSVTVTYPSTSGVTCYVISNWRANWEWATLYWLRTLNSWGISYTDKFGCASCTVIQALNNWVRNGFSPTNLALKGRAHDAGDIGAVPIKRWSAAGGMGTPGAAF